VQPSYNTTAQKVPPPHPASRRPHLSAYQPQRDVVQQRMRDCKITIATLRHSAHYWYARPRRPLRIVSMLAARASHNNREFPAVAVLAHPNHAPSRQRRAHTPSECTRTRIHTHTARQAPPGTATREHQLVGRPQHRTPTSYTRDVERSNAAQTCNSRTQKPPSAQHPPHSTDPCAPHTVPTENHRVTHTTSHRRAGRLPSDGGMLPENRLLFKIKSLHDKQATSRHTIASRHGARRRCRTQTHARPPRLTHTRAVRLLSIEGILPAKWLPPSINCLQDTRTAIASHDGIRRHTVWQSLTAVTLHPHTRQLRHEPLHSLSQHSCDMCTRC
jgi:hypothetical protein